jgi:asparagine synthase (glutamine-hydrolysing)
MCGISATLAFQDASRATAARDVVKMHDLVPRRGPDGEGFAIVDGSWSSRRVSRDAFTAASDAHVALAFRWLAVQDPDPEALLPMAGRSGATLLVFNGEIYNFVELREDLEREGCVFRTESDSEILLAAYDRWGTGCFSRFNGMWAVVLVDAAKRQVVVSRDRFGIRPLFYITSAGRIDFASEVKQLLALQSSVAANARYVKDYLDLGTLVHDDQETFFEGVRSVPPATFAVIDMNAAQAEPRFEVYWSAADHVGRIDSARAFEEVAEEFGELLRDAVRLILRTRSTTVSFLSGGLDSSVLTAMMREVEPRTREFEVCSIDFRGIEGGRFDESRYIDEFVAMHHCRAARATFDASYVRDRLRDVTWAHEEPLVASAQIAQYRAFQLVHERGAKVVIDGQGADELLGGYPDHELLAWRERMLGGHWISGGREAVALRKKFGVRALGSALRRRGGDRAQQQRAVQANIVDREVVADLTWRRLRPILHNADRNGMAHSVEGRLPFLDHRVVEMGLAIPPAMKVGGGERKRVLRRVAAGRVPPSYLARRDKMGFVTPEPIWLRNELAGDVERTLADDRLKDVFDLAEARRVVDGYRRGAHRDFRKVWRYYALPAWLETFRLL